MTRTCATNLPYQDTTSVVPEGGAASTRALAPAPPAAKAATPFAVVLARLGEEGRLVRGKAEGLHGTIPRGFMGLAVASGEQNH